MGTVIDGAGAGRISSRAIEGQSLDLPGHGYDAREGAEHARMANAESAPTS